MITSTSNDRIKRIRRLTEKRKERYEAGEFVCEGMRLVGDIPTEYISELYVTQTRVDDISARFMRREGKTIPMEIVSEDVMDHICDTGHAQGVLAVVEMPQYNMGNVITGQTTFGMQKAAPLILILEDIADPGNLGTIFRVAEAAGVTGIVLSAGTTDVFAPKVVRATMSSLFRLPFVIVNNLTEVIEFLACKGIQILAADIFGAPIYDGPDLCVPTAFVLGNEARGVSEELSGLCDGTVSLPMQGEIESLNVAMAAGLLSYEACRQRVWS